MTPRVRLLKGDCLERLEEIEAASVDMVLCDLPYGTTDNHWDTPLNLPRLWRHYERVCKGAIVLTAAQPFTSALVMSRPELFRYSWIWQKQPSGPLNAKKMPMPAHEDVLVFGAAPYYPQGLRPTLRKRSEADISRTENYQTQLAKPYTQTVTGYPTSILPFSKTREEMVHPTQKPVALLDYLIRTYTLPGAVVLDNTMGSGSTGVAAVRSGRSFVGIELDPEHYATAKARIAWTLDK
jgi:hypothetical protein